MRYTGDTEWVDALLTAARGVNLLIAEAYTPECPVPCHLGWATLRARLAALAPARVLLTHMGAAMLATPVDDGIMKAEDGLSIDL